MTYQILKTNRQDHYIPPKRAYSFEAMLDDLMDFAATTLVDNGRLAFWMPTANDEALVLEIPSHPILELISICTQTFNKCTLSPQPNSKNPQLTYTTPTTGSRRLITYTRLPNPSIQQTQNPPSKPRSIPKGTTANDLNAFRKRVSHSPSPPTTPSQEKEKHTS